MDQTARVENRKRGNYRKKEKEGEGGGGNREREVW